MFCFTTNNFLPCIQLNILICSQLQTGVVSKYASKFDRYMQLAGILETGMRDIVQKWLNGMLHWD